MKLHIKKLWICGARGNDSAPISPRIPETSARTTKKRRKFPFIPKQTPRKKNTDEQQRISPRSFSSQISAISLTDLLRKTNEAKENNEFMESILDNLLVIVVSEQASEQAPDPPSTFSQMLEKFISWPPLGLRKTSTEEVE